MTRLRDADRVEWSVLASLADFEGRRVLEIGCGEGRITRSYAAEAADVLAVDPSAADIAVARAATPPELAEHVRFAVARVEEVDLPPKSFDLALLPWSL